MKQHDHPRRECWRLMAACATLLLGVVSPQNAHPDTCAQASRAVGRSSDGRYVVTVAWLSSSLKRGSGHWMFQWQDKKTKKAVHGAVRGLQKHAHPSVLVTPEGKTFALFDPRAGHRRSDRLLIYGQDGKLIRSFGLDDLLEPGELVEFSVSHLLWLGYDSKKKRSWWTEGDATVLSLLTKAGRVVRVSLTDAKILPRPAKR